MADASYYTYDLGHFSDDQIEILLDATDGLWSRGDEAYDAVFKTLSYLYSHGWCLIPTAVVQGARQQREAVRGSDGCLNAFSNETCQMGDACADCYTPRARQQYEVTRGSGQEDGK